jgi:hypothetical protein
LDEEVEETLIEISIPKVGITSTSKNENENVAFASFLLRPYAIAAAVGLLRTCSPLLGVVEVCGTVTT